MSDKFIDINQIFKTRNPKVYKWTPQWLIRAIAKLIHEDEINYFVSQNKDVYGIDYLNATLDYLGVNIEYRGLTNIPKEKGAIVVSNHPLGGLDGLALLKTITLVRPDSHFLVNDLLMNLTNFGDLFIPVNKLGQNSVEYNRRIDELFQSDDLAILFPAGLVSRESHGVIKDLDWKKGFVTRSLKYQKMIIPVYMEGRLSNRFYRIANIRKTLGIKMNLELLFLPDEMFKQKGQTIDIIIGKPFSYKLFDLSEANANQWADTVRDFVYTLKNNPENTFENFLSMSTMNSK